MKSFAKNILFVAVVLLYTVSTMGYGVHKCSADGSASLIVFLGESPCEWVHSHIDEDGNTYTHAHAPGHHHQECSGDCVHDSNCCSTSVYVLTSPQDTSDEIVVEAPSQFDFGFLHFTDLQLSFVCGNPFVPESGISGDCNPFMGISQQVLCTFRV